MCIVNKKDIEHLLSIDKTFSLIRNKYGDPPAWSRPEGFVSLIRIILEQQISLASANAHFLKLTGYLNELTPEAIIKLTGEEMRNCQISRQKALYLKALSDAVLSGVLEIEKLSGLSEDEVRKILTSIKGIGNWTTDIYLMFCLQSKNIFPSGDIAVINTVKELWGLKSKEEIIALAETWKPFKSIATYFLWHYYLSKRNRYSA